jgi:hypothetical protein
MKIDLSKKQAGEKVFTSHDGWDVITAIRVQFVAAYWCESGKIFNVNGKRYPTDKHPTAFNSREEFDAYWAQVKE